MKILLLFCIYLLIPSIIVNAQIDLCISCGMCTLLCEDEPIKIPIWINILGLIICIILFGLLIISDNDKKKPQ